MSGKLKVILEKEANGGYSVHVPALPGCASQGETVDDALANIREAIELYLESLKADGLPLPKESEVLIAAPFPSMGVSPSSPAPFPRSCREQK